MTRRRLQYSALLTLILFLGMVGTVVLWLRAEQRQYALNRKLITALVKGDDKQALALVNEGADPNTRYEPTPVPGPIDFIKQLFHRSPLPTNDSPTAFAITCGAFWGYPNWQDRSTLLEDPKLTQAMLRHHPNVNAQDEIKMTPLMWATLSNWHATVSMLLKCDANPNVRNYSEVTSLMLAVSRDANLDIVRSLLTHGGDVTTKDNQGATPLVKAVNFGASVAVVRLLLEYGSDANAEDIHGQTLIEIARKEHRPDIITLLRHYGAKK